MHLAPCHSQRAAPLEPLQIPEEQAPRRVQQPAAPGRVVGP